MLKILVEDFDDLQQSLEYLSKLEPLQTEKSLKSYGDRLAEARPEQVTALLMNVRGGSLPFLVPLLGSVS